MDIRLTLPLAQGNRTGLASSRARRSDAGRRGTVLIIVMVTLLFAATALIAFMDKATNDLLVDHRDALDRRLRQEAYSAMEVTLSVLQEFRLASNGLHSPAEGWSDPLAFASYTPTEDRTVDVAFEDESGKISLPHATADMLTRLFQSWDISQGDSDMLADALMGWMKKEHVYSTAISPDYEQSAIPYEPPARPLRSYAELAAIDKVRDFFYDKGQPNDYWRRFISSVSLFNFSKSNINGAVGDALAAIGQYDPTQQQNMADYRAGVGQFKGQGPGYFQDVAQAQTIAGQGGDATGFATTISALRITVTVHEGKSEFRLAAVIAPQNGATTVKETATSQRGQTSATSAQSTSDRQTAPDAQTNASGAQSNRAASQNLRYPFTLLEIRENNEIPPVVSAPPTSGTP
jgi:hypothetical protein